MPHNHATPLEERGELRYSSPPKPENSQIDDVCRCPQVRSKRTRDDDPCMIAADQMQRDHVRNDGNRRRDEDALKKHACYQDRLCKTITRMGAVESFEKAQRDTLLDVRILEGQSLLKGQGGAFTPCDRACKASGESARNSLQA